MYTLYYSPGACSIAPHIVLEEIGQPYAAQRVQVDIAAKAENIIAPDYLAINPKGRVPALKIGDRVLTEAPAIMVYLARRHPQPVLIPEDPEAEGRCLEWMFWLSRAVHAVAFGQILRPQRFVGDERGHAAVIAKGRANLKAAFAFIEERVGARDWAVPGGYSIADPYLFFYYFSSTRAGLPMRDAYPAWTRLADHMTERPAVQRVLAQEGLVA